MKLRITIISAILTAGLTGMAQEPGPVVAEGSTLTLQQCRDLALDNNKNLRSGAEEVRAAG